MAHLDLDHGPDHDHGFGLDGDRETRGGLFLRLHEHQAGEGVISAAIAVLVMAFLGVLMWQLFSGTFEDAAGTVDDRVGQIGQ